MKRSSCVPGSCIAVLLPALGALALGCGSSSQPAGGGTPPRDGGADAPVGTRSDSGVAPGGDAGASDSGGGDGPTSPDSGAPPAAPRPFTALHTYYLSPTGSDTNAGTSPAMAWATPKHALVCGDVIVAAAGSYGGQFGAGSWGTVSGCPSTSGGIDGAGGIYFATVVCAGPNLASCQVDGGANEAFRVDQSSWAVEGFAGTQPASAQGGCFSGTSETTSPLHHIAFINDTAVHCALAGFDSFSWNGVTGGVDQQAVVGTIAFDGAPSTNGSGLCGSGISLIPANGPDTSPGTHVFVAGSFGYKNVNAPSGAGCNTDGEGLIFDSWGIAGYTSQAVAEQNVFWANGSAAIEAFPQGNGTTDDQATIVMLGNTTYGNHQDPKNPGGGELHLNGIYPRSGVSSYTFTDNLFEATLDRPGTTGTGTVLGADIACQNDCPEPALSIAGGFIWNSASPTTTMPGGENTSAWYSGTDQGGNWPWGTNTYGDPGFANPSALPTAAPDCSKYTNTTDCMNMGYAVAASLTPSGAASGKGYTAPGACKPDPYYPSWLKGVVYLTWNGTALSENPGLITQPCGM